MGTLKAVANRSEAFLQNFSPCFREAEIPTTGTPSSASSRRRSIVMPAAAASSIRLTQSMTRPFAP